MLSGMTAAELSEPGTLPTVIAVRGARHNSLQDVDVDVPLWRTVAVVGVSGSGKTSLAIGTLYAEGLHRFLEGLSTYSRRRLTQAQRPDVDRIDHLPPALARLRSSQRGALYVFDESSTGLHPLDVATLVSVFDRLLAAGATIIVIDYDLDLLAAADHLIDMGPGGGPDGGRILAAGTPQDVARTLGSAPGPWLAEHLTQDPPGVARGRKVPLASSVAVRPVSSANPAVRRPAAQ